MENQTNRFGELALELFGAQAVKNFIDQVWSNASPEVKRDLADKVLTALAAKFAEPNNWEMRNVVDRKVAELTEATISGATLPEGAIERVQAEFRRDFEQSWQGRVSRGVHMAIDKALQHALSQMPRWASDIK